MDIDISSRNTLETHLFSIWQQVCFRILRSLRCGQQYRDNHREMHGIHSVLSENWPTNRDTPRYNTVEVSFLQGMLAQRFGQQY